MEGQLGEVNATTAEEFRNITAKFQQTVEWTLWNSKKAEFLSGEKVTRTTDGIDNSIRTNGGFAPTAQDLTTDNLSGFLRELASAGIDSSQFTLFCTDVMKDRLLDIDDKVSITTVHDGTKSVGIGELDFLHLKAQKGLKVYGANAIMDDNLIYFLDVRQLNYGFLAGRTPNVIEDRPDNLKDGRQWSYLAEFGTVFENVNAMGIFTATSA